MTYHLWYEQFPLHLKNLANQLQAHPFWKTACNVQASSCIIRNVKQMDELYFSKAPTNNNRRILYGAAGNYDLHVDGIFKFPGIRFYRVLIGLSGNNKSVETSFPTLKSSIYLNKNDYVIFDFDRSRHQVHNHSIETDANQYRVMLKLHFCVCDTCHHESLYFKTVCKLYTIYEVITRYIMQKGTNPVSYYEFFLGLLVHIATRYPWVVYTFCITLFGYILMILLKQKYATYFGLFLLYTCLTYLTLVLIFWLRFKLYGTR
jgi:hypothetical protein